MRIITRKDIARRACADGVAAWDKHCGKKKSVRLDTLFRKVFKLKNWEYVEFLVCNFLRPTREEMKEAARLLLPKLKTVKQLREYVYLIEGGILNYDWAVFMLNTGGLQVVLELVQRKYAPKPTPYFDLN